MPCFNPLKGYKRADGGFTLDYRKSLCGVVMHVPCNGCIGCRLSRAMEWTARILTEKTLWEWPWFITLTFDNEHLPENYSADVEVVQKFFHRFRKAVLRDPAWVGARPGAQVKIRYFLVSDYGTIGLRPHYHLVVFIDYDFSDREPWYASKMGHPQWISPRLTSIWGQGEVTLSYLDEGNAVYCTRHNVRKVTGRGADEHYRRLHPLTGEIIQARPEFMTCSRRPGIGAEWFKKFEADVFPCDFLVMHGRKWPVPKFFARQLKGRFLLPGSKEVFLESAFGPELSKIETVDDFKRIGEKRLLRLETDQFRANNTPERLAVREESAWLRFNRSDREL